MSGDLTREDGPSWGTPDLPPPPGPLFSVEQVQLTPGVDPVRAHALMCAVILVAGYQYGDPDEAAMAIADAYVDYLDPSRNGDLDPIRAHALHCAVTLVAGYNYHVADDASLKVAEKYERWLR